MQRVTLLLTSTYPLLILKINFIQEFIGRDKMKFLQILHLAEVS